MRQLQKLYVKMALGVAVVIVVLIAAWVFVGPESAIGGAIGGLAIGLRSFFSGKRSGSDSSGRAEARSDQAVEKLQGSTSDLIAGNRLVQESLERSSVELESVSEHINSASQSASGNGKQLDNAIDILEGRKIGSPDRLH